MAVAASTQRVLSSASASKGMKGLVVRWMSTNACLILATMMPPAWTRSEGSTASACQVKHRFVIQEDYFSFDMFFSFTLW